MNTHTPPSNQPPSTAPMPSSSVHPHLQQPHISPVLSHQHPARIPQPPAFYVPLNVRQVVDFSRNSRTPESKVKTAVLSEDPNQNAIAVVGMGGVGKTTMLRALGRHEDVWAKFRDGVWFVQLGHDATVQTVLDELEDVVAKTLPDFSSDFTRLAAKPNKHLRLMNMLVEHLACKRFLLMFDDVWDLDASVYKLVDAVCTGVQKMEGTSCKVLSSTRNEAIGRVPTHDVSIGVSAEDWRGDRCVDILCCYAGINRESIGTLGARNRDALGRIIDMCAGLPLALSVAACGLQDVLGRGAGGCGEDGIEQYWKSLRASTGQLGAGEGGNRHSGLKVAVETSLRSLEKKWRGEGMRVGEMFRSFCIMQKQQMLPLRAIEKVWGVRDGLCGVRMFSRHSLVSLVKDECGLEIGVVLHDLVHDMCVEQALGSEGVGFWHKRVVDGYGASIQASGSSRDGESSGMNVGSGSREVRWWEVDSDDKYIVDNVVRHLLGAGEATEALGLLTDYRWVERTNEDEDRALFRKVIAELRLLQSFIVEHVKTTMGKKVTRDIEVIVKAMVLCMVSYCMENWDECTFQLFGRLRDVKSESGIVERLVSSIERYRRVPWARAGPKVVTGGGGMLKRVLNVGIGICMCIVGGGEKVVVGGWNGKVRVYNGWDGAEKMSLVGDEEEYRLLDVYYDHSSRRIYSCSGKGRVVAWEEYKMCYCVQAEGLQEDEEIECMEVLPKRGRVVLGTSKGRLLVMDIEGEGTCSQNAFQTVDAHDSYVMSLTTGRSEDVVVSRSKDGRIRVWDAENFADTENELERHEDWVTSLALSGDGRLLASGSEDGTVRIFDLERREQLWSSSTAHDYSVSCVLFSEDASLLYSADACGTIHVWKLSGDGPNVSLLRTLRHSTMERIESLCIGDDSELFALNGTQVYVWDARDVENRDDQVAAFLPDVYAFAFSADEATMLTLNKRSKCLEIRDVCDVSECIDRVVSSVDISNFEFGLSNLAVSNDRKYVAFVEGSYFHEVHIYDPSEGVLLRTLSDVKQSALASIGYQQGNSASDGASGDSGDSASDEPDVIIDSLRFSADGSTISAVAEVVIWGEHGKRTQMTSKRICWNVCSGAVLEEAQVDGETNASNSSSSAGMNCGEQSSALSVDRFDVVRCEHDGKCFTIATLEILVGCWHYSHKARLWFASMNGGVFHIDLMTENSQRNLYDNRPPLPQLHPPPSEDATKHKDQDRDTEAEEVYDVFISHAGPDKWTIAKPLYDLLVALGLKVFLDTAELKPGQHAPQKMIHAMQTAKIAVVILSPEFAARKWTMKELICFLDRSAAGGERGVIIIPVFYRLSLNECKDQKLLAGLKNDAGENALAADGFLERIGKEGHYRMEEIMGALQAVTVMTGIENKVAVTNGASAEEVAERKEYVESIGDAVEKANRRLESGRAAGPSGS